MLRVAFLKVVIAFVVIGFLEKIAAFNDKNEQYCFEISMSILMAGWILHNGW